MSLLRPLLCCLALCAATAMGPAAWAQQSEVEDPSQIGDFRLDQPAGPGNPVRTQPPVAAPTPAPAPTRTQQPTPTEAQPATRQPARPAPETRRPAAVPATQAQRTADTPNATQPETPTPTDADGPAQPSLFDNEPNLPAVSETLPDAVVSDAITDNATATAPQVEDVANAPTDIGQKILPYWPYAAGGIALLLLALALWRSGRARRADSDTLEEALDADVAPALDLTEAAQPEPAVAPAPAPNTPKPAAAMEPKRAPSGTIGIPIAKVAEGIAPAPTQPSVTAQGFVTTRAPKAEPPRPAIPAGTVGIPASRIAPPAEPPPPALELVEGTQLAAQFAAPELIRDEEGLRLRFALGIGNIGTMAAKDVQLRTVLLTAAPDSDRAIAEWLSNPNGPAAATIPHIDGGTQTNVTGDIRLNADQIRAMSMQGTAIFVPMFAISIDFVGAEGLDRFGEAYVIGLPPERGATNGKARVLPLPHDGKLPRRWTDLLHSRANIGG